MGIKRKRSLIEIIQEDLGKVISSYHELDELSQELLGKNVSKQLRAKKYQRKPGNLKVVKELFQKLVDQPSTDFDLDNIRQLNDIYSHLENILPDNDDVEMFIDECVKKFDKNLLVEAQEKSQFWLKPLSAISAAMGVGALLTGNYFATVLYAASSISALATLREDNIKLRLVTYGTVLSAAASIAFSGNELSDLEGVILIAHNIYMPGLVRTATLFGEEQKLNKLTSELRAKAEINFDRFLRYETVLKEAYQNLSYVGRVCSSERRLKNDFLPQIERLEEILIKYLDGKATFDDVKDCQVKYVPKEVEKRKQVMKVVASQGKTATYTKDEYVQLREQEEKQRRDQKKQNKRRKPETSSVASIVNVSVQEDITEVIFSRELAEAYDSKNSLIAGYGARSLLDLTKAKLSSNRRHQHVKGNTAPAKRIIRNLQRKHDFNSSVTIYKFRPRGSLRGFYVMEDDTITVLDIMNHQEYDLIFRKG
jgi:hypothetical protein